MDYEEVQGAYQRAMKSNDQFNKKYYQESHVDKNHGIERNKPSEFPNGFGYPSAPVDTEVDYSIVKMPNGTYVVGRSRRLGSLNYDYVCTCETQFDAREIVESLNK